MTTFTGPGRPFRSTMRVPGDKSLSHRALILSAMAGGTSKIVSPAPGEDVAATRGALERLGVHLGPATVHSPGVDGWLPSAEPLDLGNSGTALRLLCGALAGRPFRSVLVGDESLNRRPMRRLAEPLAQLGATVEVSDRGTPPVAVAGGALRGTELRIPLPSAQVRTAVMLAALQAEGLTLVDSPPGFRDHTERWLATLGLGRYRSSTAFEIGPGPVPPASYHIPGDTSSAAYLWAAAALIPGATVTVEDVSLNPGRTGFLDVIESMGARVERTTTGMVLGDPTGEVRVTGASLQGTVVGGETAARAIDELPLVAILAAGAEGATRIGDAAELHAKESDRIASTVAMVEALGASAEPTEDGFVVSGSEALRGGTVDAAGDHRIAMAAAVAATACTEPVAVRGFDAAGVSWPGFRAALEELWSSR